MSFCGRSPRFGAARCGQAILVRWRISLYPDLRETLRRVLFWVWAGSGPPWGPPRGRPGADQGPHRRGDRLEGCRGSDGVRASPRCPSSSPPDPSVRRSVRRAFGGRTHCRFGGRNDIRSPVWWILPAAAPPSAPASEPTSEPGKAQESRQKTSRCRYFMRRGLRLWPFSQAERPVSAALEACRRSRSRAPARRDPGPGGRKCPEDQGFTAGALRLD